MRRIEPITRELSCGEHTWSSSAYSVSCGPTGKILEEFNDPKCPECGKTGVPK